MMRVTSVSPPLDPDEQLMLRCTAAKMGLFCGVSSRERRFHC